MILKNIPLFHTVWAKCQCELLEVKTFHTKSLLCCADMFLGYIIFLNVFLLFKYYNSHYKGERRMKKESEEDEGMEREGRMRKEEKEGRDCSRRKISWSSLSIM